MEFNASPLSRSTLLDELSDQLEGRILTGELQVGVMLPSELMLAETFSVSRPVVREALAKLRERGLLETVTGKGTVVRRPDVRLLTDVLVRHLHMTDPGLRSLANLYEARAAIEVGAASAAAQRAEDSDIEEIRFHLAAMDGASGNVADWTASDLNFHLSIANATHNPFFATLLCPLFGAIEEGIHESHRSPEAVAAGLASHWQILDAICSKDAASAAEAMQDHLEDSRQRFQAAIGSAQPPTTQHSPQLSQVLDADDQ